MKWESNNPLKQIKLSSVTLIGNWGCNYMFET